MIPGDQFDTADQLRRISIRAPAEGGLDYQRHAVGGVHDPSVIEALHLAAGGSEPRREVLAPDAA
jgi:hypothetical protein